MGFLGLARLKATVKHHLASPTPGGLNTTTVPQSGPESRKNEAIQAFWSGISMRQGLEVKRMVLPNDAPDGSDQKKRELEWFRQASMPWGSQFMHTQTDSKRLNNPAQASFMKQRQLAGPNSYRQFYAFMRAMSAAFGNLQQ